MILTTDPYLDPATGVMCNQLGITDATILAQMEELTVSVAAAEILNSFQPARWDAALLQHLHRE
ncbi:hypothetical protein [Actinomyces capricornis]|uniref:Uncharacterized protein n=1 Tax=Actinomyces capricornis TaxID=2755559 RepID=A0ABM7UFD4_9ACTO|nr:hypothetical protein [Actinomyces capricornis]BDA65727.1 hypothetical protein MANAM107_25610 [Actinomyces capricornis]